MDLQLLGGDLILVEQLLDRVLQLQVLTQVHNLEVFVDMLGQISWFKTQVYLEIHLPQTLNMKLTIN